MPKRNAPEFSYDEKTQLYRKKIKNPNTGKWVPVYGHTKAECRAKIKEKEAAFDRQLLLKENPLVWQYAQQWYKLHTGNYSQKRKDDYRNAINNHICPVIGQKLLREVTYSDIMEVMAKLDGRSKSLQQKVVTTLRELRSLTDAHVGSMSWMVHGCRPNSATSQPLSEAIYASGTRAMAAQ